MLFSDFIISKFHLAFHN
uniref:Uncharacterized protein n=1 Tax=Anguilla anguilla TaxID=7936 RepID=A0A0E9VYF5_ANGAN